MFRFFLDKIDKISRDHVLIMGWFFSDDGKNELNIRVGKKINKTFTTNILRPDVYQLFSKECNSEKVGFAQIVDLKGHFFDNFSICFGDNQLFKINWVKIFKLRIKSVLAFRFGLKTFSKNFTEDYKIIRKSRLFNQVWYFNKYKEVRESGLDPVYHYLQIGWRDGFNPSEQFSSNEYLELNNDIANIGMNPLLHYEKYGKKERRRISYEEKSKSINVNRSHFYDNMNDLIFIRDKKYEKKDLGRLAIQFHIFYVELLDEIYDYLSRMSVKYDLYISTYEEDKKNIIETFFRDKEINLIAVDVFENKGRDVYPFLSQIHPVYKKYDFIIHAHTKKSLTVEWGDIWRHFLYDNIFGKKYTLANILLEFDKDPQLGVMAPPAFPLIKDLIRWKDGEKEMLSSFYKKINVNDIKLEGRCLFPAGNMFCARVSAIEPILEYKFTVEDFPEEKGQTDFTLQHMVERCWKYLVEARGYKYKECLAVPDEKYGMEKVYEEKSNKRICFFVHYDKDQMISEEDLLYLKELKKVANEIVFITNSGVIEDEKLKLNGITELLYSRENVGYDFGAWKDGLKWYGYEKLDKFEQLLLVNNSVFPPLFDLNFMFDEMELKNKDFWGVTKHEYVKYLPMLGKFCPEHIQTYFVVFNSKVFKSVYFKNFWETIEYQKNFQETVKYCEVLFTEYFKKNGFSFGCYFDLNEKFTSVLGDSNMSYMYPDILFEMKVPLLKKKNQAGFTKNIYFKLREMVK